MPRKPLPDQLAADINSWATTIQLHQQADELAALARQPAEPLVLPRDPRRREAVLRRQLLRERQRCKRLIELLAV